MSSPPQTFHPIERSILNSLSSNDYVGTHSLAASTGLSIDQIRRGIEWLKFKNLISIEESSTQRVFAASEGMEAAKKGLPERRLVDSLKEGKITISEVLASGAIKNEEINAAIAGARRNQWIQLVEGKMVPTPLAAKKSPGETFIENLLKREEGGGGLQISKLTEEEKHVLELLKKRPNYIEIKEEKELRISLTDAAKQKIIPTLTQEEKKKLESRLLTTELITSGKWRETDFSALDVQAPAPVIYPGRRHPLIEIIEEIKEIFVGLGFSEIEGPIIQSGFWNFDALFTPQDHPARHFLHFRSSDTAATTTTTTNTCKQRSDFKNFSGPRGKVEGPMGRSRSPAASPPYTHYACNYPASCKGKTGCRSVLLSGQGF
jgi:phenylalanyl-tRNA synthetase alpha chain